MARPLGAFAVWIALVAYSLTALCPGEGLLLCIEADGHVGIESVASGCADCCAPAISSSEAGVQAQSCPCLDVYLTSSEGLLSKPRSTDGLIACAHTPRIVGCLQDLALLLDARCAPASAAQRLSNPLHELLGPVVLQV